MWSEAAEGVSMTVGPVAGASADPASELAALVRRSRVLARLTQEELAERTGLSSRTVRNIVISGAAGVGKTALVARKACRC
jgi:ATP-dependent Clp protease ATP-binding subunit ClpA